MTNISVQKVERPDLSPLPLFKEIGKLLDLVPQKAFELFEKRGRELGHALDDWLQAEREVMGWPAAEMTERHGEYELHLALPGFEAAQVRVVATPSEIIVHAESGSEKKAEGNTVLWTEFARKDVYRRFETPEPIVVDKIHATLDKGVLHIIAVKASAAKPRATQVGAG
jgi:HSP20 family molecular chaperone IbpA